MGGNGDFIAFWEGVNIACAGANIACAGTNIACTSTNIACASTNIACAGANIACAGAISGCASKIIGGAGSIIVLFMIGVWMFVLFFNWLGWWEFWLGFGFKGAKSGYVALAPDCSGNPFFWVWAFGVWGEKRLERKAGLRC